MGEGVEGYLRKFGLYQVLFLLTMIPPVIIGPIPLFALTFAAALPPLRCCVPQFDNCSSPLSTPFYTPQYLNETERDYWFSHDKRHGANSYCGYCSNNGTFHKLNNTCSEAAAQDCQHGVLFDTSQYHTSLAIQFGMYCQDVWKSDLLKSLYMVGVLLGAAIGGFASDKFGRRPTFLFCAFSMIPSYLVAPFINNYAAFGFFEIINGGLQTVLFGVAFVCMMELVFGIPRTMVSMTLQLFFSLAYLLTDLFAYFIRDSKWLLFSLSSLILLLIPYYWIFPESITWALMNGKQEDAKRNLAKIGRLNNFKVPDSIALNDRAAEKTGNEDSGSDVSFRSVFTNRSLRRTAFITFYNWFTCSMVYYGLSLNTADLPGSAYVSFALIGMAEIPAYIFIVPLMEFWGRKPSSILLQAVSGSCLLGTAFIPKGASSGLDSLIVVLATTGKLCIAAAFAVMWQYSSEIFPTQIRNSGTGISSVFARVGSILAPQIHLLAYYAAPWVPNLVYGSFAIAASLLDFFLPETRGIPLPNTLEDALAICENRWEKQKPSKFRNTCNKKQARNSPKRRKEGERKTLKHQVSVDPV